jgi:hypothetical protein
MVADGTRRFFAASFWFAAFEFDGNPLAHARYKQPNNQERRQNYRPPSRQITHRSSRRSLRLIAVFCAIQATSLNQPIDPGTLAAKPIAPPTQSRDLPDATTFSPEVIHKSAIAAAILAWAWVQTSPTRSQSVCNRQNSAPSHTSGGPGKTERAVTNHRCLNPERQ